MGRLLTRVVFAGAVILESFGLVGGVAFAESPTPARWQGQLTSGHAPILYNSGQGMAIQDGGVGADAINVMAPPNAAKCDGVTDDLAAINAKIAAAHTLGTATQKPVKIFFPGTAMCGVSAAINMTGWSDATTSSQYNGMAVTVEGYGAYIQCTPDFVNASAMMDVIGSRFVKIRGLNFACQNAHGGGHEPTAAIQYGNRSPTIGTGDNHLRDISVDGSFSIGPIYNLSSEVSSIDNLSTFQHDASAFGNVVFDGSYHFGGTSPAITSTYAPITITPDTHMSFTENQITNSSITVENSPAVPLWISDSQGLLVSNTYMNTTGDQCIEMFVNQSQSNLLGKLNFTVHCEADMDNTFLVSGAYATPQILGLTYRDEANFSTAAIFAMDTGVTHVTIQDFDVHVSLFKNGGTTVFDTPADWTASGYFWAPTSGQWNQPTAWSGFTNLNDVFSATVTTASPFEVSNASGESIIRLNPSGSNIGSIRAGAGSSTNNLCFYSKVAGVDTQALCLSNGGGSFANGIGVTGTAAATAFQANGNAGVACSVGTLNPVTAIVVGGIVTHC